MLHPDEAPCNVASIHSVPQHILPPGRIRNHLVALAAEGRDVYAYQSGGPHGTWCVWLETIRVPIVEYVATFAQPVTAAVSGRDNGQEVRR